MSNQPARKSSSAPANAASRRSGTGTATTKIPANGAARPVNGADRPTSKLATGGAGRPAPAAPGKAGVKPVRGGNGKISVAPARASKPAAKRKGPLGFRPLDLALIGLGVLGVLGLVWAVLTNDGQGSASDPRVRLANRGNVQNLAVGATAPDFTLPSTEGSTYSLSQFRGKVVMLELMAPWCPHCQADSSILNQIYDSYKDKIQMLAVNATPFGHKYESDNDTSLITMDDQKWFHDTFGLQYPLLFDKDVKAADDYGVTSFPTIYVIDPSGKIVSRPDSDVSLETLSAALDTALKNAGTAAPAAQPAATATATK